MEASKEGVEPRVEPGVDSNSEIAKREGVVESRENQFELFETKIVDAEGKEVCSAKIEFVKSDEYPGSMEVKRYMVVPVGGGEPIDLLALTDIKDTRIFIGSGERPAFRPHDSKTEGRTIHIPTPNSTLDIGTALHEMGHSAQSDDERFIDLDYGAERYLEDKSMSLLDRWDQVVLSLNKRSKKNGLEHVSDEVVSEANRLFAERFSVKKKLDQISDRIKITQEEIKKFEGFVADGTSKGEKDKVAFFSQKINEKNSEIIKMTEDKLGYINQQGEVEGRIFKLIIDNKKALSTEAGVSTRVLERDATKRALVWMRALKQKHGIDLFAAQNANQDIEKLKDSAESRGMQFEEHPLLFDCDEGKANAYDLLKVALGTYEADRSEGYRRRKEENAEKLARDHAISLAKSVESDT